MKKIDITIPEDYQPGYVRDQMTQRLAGPRRWLDRPAFYGTPAQVGGIDKNKKDDYSNNVKS